jgi:hypothetical protein
VDTKLGFGRESRFPAAKKSSSGVSRCSGD